MQQIIEMFGDYWHPSSDVEMKTNHYLKYGFTTLVVWQSELADAERVLAKIEAFAKGGMRYVSVS